MKIFQTSCLGAGFTRMDAITLTFSMMLIGAIGWAGFWLGGEKRRIWACENHLKELGQTFTSYTYDHRGNLPVGVYDDGKTSNTWDHELMADLEPKNSGSGKSDGKDEPAPSVRSIFKCPSDPGPYAGGLARSYAMPIYDINKAGWPADQNSESGLGLYLDKRTLRKAHMAMDDSPSGAIPALNVTAVPDPSGTALLVECIVTGNHIGQIKYACAASVKDQFQISTVKPEDFHGGKMNYLLLDGHVELLSPAQSGGQVGADNQGMWTIRPED
jgi:prepilin-type processing-associated H-X9-DG protein